MLRDGNDPFYPDRDRPEFDRFLAVINDTTQTDPGDAGSAA